LNKLTKLILALILSLSIVTPSIVLANQDIQPITTDISNEDRNNPLMFISASVLVIGGLIYVIKRHNNR